MLSLFRGKQQTAVIVGTLEIRHPWARPSSQPTPDKIAGAFLAITNKGPGDDRLIAASTMVADSVELHSIKVVGADIDMRPMPGGLVLPAGFTMTLQPRGYHLLLRGVSAPLHKGSTVPITLTFEKAGTLALDFAVEEPGLIGEAILNEEYHRG
jgi:copper(I)-binding protein